MQKLMVKFSYSELKIADGKFICSMQEKQKKKKETCKLFSVISLPPRRFNSIYHTIMNMWLVIRWRDRNICIESLTALFSIIYNFPKWTMEWSLFSCGE